MTDAVLTSVFVSIGIGVVGGLIGAGLVLGLIALFRR